MAKAKLQPTGGQMITAVLNRAHPEIASLLSGFSGLRDLTEFKRALRGLRNRVWKGLVLGENNRYFASAGARAAELFAMVGDALGVPQKWGSDSVPTYFDGGETIPFGRFVLPEEILNVRSDLQQYERETDLS